MNPLSRPISTKVSELLSPQTIRSRSRRVLELCEAGKTHFNVNRDRLGACAEFVASVTKTNYPSLNIPFHSRWSHFLVGGIDRVAPLQLNAKAQFDLALVSVLLDAGAGTKWRYRDSTGFVSHRSEGLAVASLEAFSKGLFGNRGEESLQVSSSGLRSLSVEELGQAFQVTPSNPISGFEGRVRLLNQLASALDKNGFHRPSDLLEHLPSVSSKGHIGAAQVLRALQVCFGSIWPGRLRLDDFDLGDVWSYAPMGEGWENWIPFHKLSQWLTYSLAKPIEAFGLQVSGFEELSGLPEYRNGGLLIDMGVLSLKNPQLMHQAHAASSELIVEWRALTICLLEELAPWIRKHLGPGAEKLQLGQLLEGGTWFAGRKLADEKRAGASPIQIESDGTVI